ncbi:hypothetical protein MMC22_010000 [Lobaria immixta]|nr:hypothetical protein [Lobaria immixta]
MSPKTTLVTGGDRDQYYLGARKVENDTAAIDELRKTGILAKIEVIHLDVDSDSSIIAADPRALPSPFPPLVSSRLPASYGVSKTALNSLTIELAKAKPEVRFYAAGPGHTKTAFNGVQGTKEPLDAAKVVVELASAENGKYEPGFWQMEGDSQEAMKVP